MRSFVFNIAFYGCTALFAIVCLPLCFLPYRKPLVAAVHWWARGILGLMRSIAGIRVEVRGLTNVAKDRPHILASKHQSYSDGIVMMSLIPDLAVVAMKELLSFPIVGRVLKRLEMIMVDRCGGGKVRSKFNGTAKLAHKRGRNILIYPEGRLVPVGERSPYRNGVYHLYEELGLPVVPVATNIGLRWHLNEWRKKPGDAVVSLLPPIQAGLDRETFMSVLEQRIEDETGRLVAEHA